MPNITLKLHPYSAGTPRNPVRCASRPYFEKKVVVWGEMIVGYISQAWEIIGWISQNLGNMGQIW